MKDKFRDIFMPFVPSIKKTYTEGGVLLGLLVTVLFLVIMSFVLLMVVGSWLLFRTHWIWRFLFGRKAQDWCKKNYAELGKLPVSTNESSCTLPDPISDRTE